MKRFMMGLMQIGGGVACARCMWDFESTVVIVSLAVLATAHGMCAALNVMESLFGDDGLFPLWKVDIK